MNVSLEASDATAEGIRNRDAVLVSFANAEGATVSVVLSRTLATQLNRQLDRAAKEAMGLHVAASR